jgi:hypothetical protein
MTEYPTCGLWPGRKRIAASVIDGDCRLHRLWMAPADESEAWTCVTTLERHFGLDVRLVIPESTPAVGLLVRCALDRTIPVLVAPQDLVLALDAVLHSQHRPRSCATLLARLPGSRFRSNLRTIPTRDPRQLALL